MVDVFISYARENSDTVRRIADCAAAEGYSVWWDVEIPPHLAYGEVIADEIDNAKAVIVVWSRDAAASRWVRSEADRGLEQAKLIQTTVDGTFPPMPFNQIQSADLAGWQGEPDHPGWTKVKTSLRALCKGETARPRPAPAPPPAAAPAYAAAAVTAPPAAAGAFGAPQQAGRNKAIAAGVGAAILLPLLAALVFFSMRGDEAAQADEPPSLDNVQNQAAPAPPPAGPAPTGPRPTDAQFTQAATVDDPAGLDVRSGPSGGFPVVGRIAAGELLTTYPQDGEWWQVRMANSRVGYVERGRFRMIDTPPAQAEQQAAPSAGGDKQTRQLALSVGFAPDPADVQVQAGGTTDVAQLDGNCRGYMSQTPDVRLDYSAGSLPLTFYTAAQMDLTMLVIAPDGSRSCADDSIGLQPALRFDQPQSGTYLVWVGVYGQTGALEPATLRITELTPQ